MKIPISLLKILFTKQQFGIDFKNLSQTIQTIKNLLNIGTASPFIYFLVKIRKQKSNIKALSYNIVHTSGKKFIFFVYIYIRIVNSLIKNCIYAIYFVNGGTNGPSSDTYGIVLIFQVTPTLISIQVKNIYLFLVCFSEYDQQGWEINILLLKSVLPPTVIILSL